MNFLGFKFGGSKSPGPSPSPAAPHIRSIGPDFPKEVINAAAMQLLRIGMESDGKGGVQSAATRMVRELNDPMIRAYDAAVTTPYDNGFYSTYGSADAEIQSSLYTVRGRTRTLCKDTPHGKSIIRGYQNNVIGHRGFRLNMRLGKQAKSGNKKKFIPNQDLNDEIELLYKNTGKPKNWGVAGDLSRMAAYRIMEASAIRDGFILLRHWKGFPNKYGYAAQLLEGDRLQESYLGRAPNSNNEIRFSCELDIWKRKVAYWVLSRHPGDPFCGAPLRDSNVWRERIPADEIILYSNMADRAEQTVGFPELDSIAKPLYRDQQYATALTLAAIGACCKPFWIKKAFPTGMTFTSEQMNALIGEVSDAMRYGPGGVIGNGPSSGTLSRQEGLSAPVSNELPASTRIYNYGEELMQTSAQDGFPVEAAVGFKKDNLHMIAAGSGISYQLLSMCYDNLGFSATRACQVPQQDHFKVRQANFRDMVVEPEFEERVRCAIMCGKCSAPMEMLDAICEGAHWLGTRWPFINPLQDIQATILQLEAGLISPQQVLAEMEDGVSMEHVYQLLEEARDAQEDHGLDFTDEQATKPTVKSGEVEETLPEPSSAQPPSATKTANPVRRNRHKVRISPEIMRMIEAQGDGTHNGNGH